MLTDVSHGSDKTGMINITLHPSNRLALASYDDRRVRLWDLMKGGCLHTTKAYSETLEVSDYMSFSKILLTVTDCENSFQN